MYFVNFPDNHADHVYCTDCTWEHATLFSYVESMDMNKASTHFCCISCGRPIDSERIILRERDMTILSRLCIEDMYKSAAQQAAMIVRLQEELDVTYKILHDTEDDRDYHIIKADSISAELVDANTKINILTNSYTNTIKEMDKEMDFVSNHICTIYTKGECDRRTIPGPVMITVRKEGS